MSSPLEVALSRIDRLKRECDIRAGENLKLCKEIDNLNDRIKELESKCVMGGDGKPIGIGEQKFTKEHNGPCIVSTVGEYTISFTNQYTCAKPSDCYSSPDDVPGGAE